jgi:fibronectin-binding autotransporter adhesin
VNQETLTIGAPIANNPGGGVVALTKSGDGTLTLSNTNILAGVTLHSGTLTTMNNSALGAGRLTLLGGTLSGGGALRTFTNDASIGGVVGFSTVAFTGGAVTLLGDTTIWCDGGVNSPVNLYVNIAGNGSLKKAGSNTMLTLSGNNTYTGTTIVASVPNSGYSDDMALGGTTGNSVPGDLIIDDGTGPGVARVTLLASERIADTGLVTLGNRGWLQLNGFNETLGGLEGGGDVSVNYSIGSVDNGKKSTLTIRKTSGTSEFYGTVKDSEVNPSYKVTLSLIKTGDGAQILTSPCRHTGATVISNGTLVITGLAAGPTVTNVAGVLGASGVVARDMVIQDGATLAPGSSGIGRLTVNNLWLSSGCTNLFDLGTTNASDRIDVNGNLTLGGTFAVTNAPTFAGKGIYPIITYTGTLTDYGTTATAFPGYKARVMPDPAAKVVWMDVIKRTGFVVFIK